MRNSEAVIARASHRVRSQQHKHTAVTQFGELGPAPTRGDLGRSVDALTTLPAAGSLLLCWGSRISSVTSPQTAKNVTRAVTAFALSTSGG